MHFTIKSLLRLFPWQKTIFTLSYVQLLKCIKGKVLSIHKGVNSFCCSPLRLIQISGKLNFFQLSDVTIYNCFTRPAVSVRVKLYLFKHRHVWIENWICSQQSAGSLVTSMKQVTGTLPLSSLVVFSARSVDHFSLWYFCILNLYH